MTYRILVTGSRRWRDYLDVWTAINNQMPDGDAKVVHGDCPDGVDAMAQEFCENFDIPVEKHNARGFPSFKARNQHMVDLGANVCLAFATSWMSGTGQTARMARKAGIRTIDYGVATDWEACPALRQDTVGVDT